MTDPDFDPDAHVEGARRIDLTFWAIDGGIDITRKAPALLFAAWEPYMHWYLRDGETARPSYWECRHALASHMPELLPEYDALVIAVGGGDLEARFLSHWCPPPLFTACSLAAMPEGRVLWRTYDFPPQMCDRTMLRSQWGGTTVLGMADCVLGLLDGMNEHGLAAAIAFGGRSVVGSGFGVGLVIRYVLQTCRNVEQALAVLARVPIHMAYNVSLLDAEGEAAIVRVAPDRPLERVQRLTAANRPGTTEWPEHAEFCATVEREEALKDLEGKHADAARHAFMEPPLQRPTGLHPWGTVYAAAYDVQAATAELAWPEQSWRLSLHRFAEGQITRATWLAPPPARHVPLPSVARRMPILIL